MIIDENNIGQRIDKYLTDNTEYTRSKIQKMIDNGNILVNGKEVKSSYILKEDDNIEINDYIEETDIIPENIPLDIYYEDEDLIVKRKTIDVKPMDEEEAILQMELLNHDFFMFKNIDEDCISVLYRRKDGKFGILNSN